MSNDTIQLIEGFSLDLARGCLMHAGEEVHLRPQTYEVLTYLVENRGRLISKDKLIEDVWQGRAVTDSSLVKCIEELREALGENALKYIRNVRGRGYIFDSEANGLVGKITSEQIDIVRVAVVDSEKADPAKYLAEKIRTHKLGVALAVLVVLVAAGGLAYWFFGRPSNTTQITSVAVLPFLNESGNPDVDYLSDGITESLINSLSQLPNVRVMARTTMFSFKGKATDPRAVGEQLSVDAVLMGRVVQRGDSLTIQTDLVKVSDGSQIWGEHYNKKASDILAVQDDISREIVGKLRVRLSGEQEQRVAKRYTDNAEAYQLYLLGRFHWNKLTEEGARKSIDYFEQALAKDPNYALAYFGLSDAYAVLGQIGFRPNEVCPKALVYAEKALAVDPTLLEAHFSRGAYELFYGWNWTTAEQELKRAMEPNTNVAGAHDLYGQFLSAMGRFDEGIAQNKRALELDPLSPLSNSNLEQVYYYARQYDLAVEQQRKVTELDTNFFLARLYIGWAYGQQGKYREAIAELTRTRDLPGGFVPATSELGYVYAVSGHRSEAQKMLRELQERAKREFIDPYYIAIIYIGLGDQEQSFAWLNKAYEERSPWLLWLKVEPKFDHLRADARFRDLLRRVGLPQ